MRRRSLLHSVWVAVVCAAGPAWAGPKVIEITLVQDGALVEGTTTLPPVPMEKFRSVTLLGNVGPGAIGVVSVDCAYTLEEARDLGMVPAVDGFHANVSNQVSSSAFPAPVLGPFMLCTLSCSTFPPPAPPMQCTGTVTVKALLSK
jgi:hypothetical protein